MSFPITLLDNPNKRLPPLCRWPAIRHLHLALLTYTASALLTAVGVHRFHLPRRRHTPLKPPASPASTSPASFTILSSSPLHSSIR
ncbi:hypothetical protein L2E82_11738 [Cichorium intybus]|uniref:Uncharacterized protein n=1 Tax=Cichorium intybus TaxID=13427 RepID=A0ACB9GFB0_CICIN|nr:hypothetical protein L2E82_11738 [Cichorium intybus]